jgi:hypothetical protein
VLKQISGTHVITASHANYLKPQLNHFRPQGGAFNRARFPRFGFSGTATRRQGDGPASLRVSFHSWADFLLGMPAQAGKVDQLRNPNSVGGNSTRSTLVTVTTLRQGLINTSTVPNLSQGIIRYRQTPGLRPFRRSRCLRKFTR